MTEERGESERSGLMSFRVAGAIEWLTVECPRCYRAIDADGADTIGDMLRLAEAHRCVVVAEQTAEKPRCDHGFTQGVCPLRTCGFSRTSILAGGTACP